MMKDLKEGDYVLATKFHDGDSGDPWAVGFYAGLTEHDRYLVKDGNDNHIRASGYRRVGKISHDLGSWLMNNADDLESMAAPAETFNLWMIAGHAEMKDLLYRIWLTETAKPQDQRHYSPELIAEMEVCLGVSGATP